MTISPSSLDLITRCLQYSVVGWLFFSLIPLLSSEFGFFKGANISELSLFITAVVLISFLVGLAFNLNKDTDKNKSMNATRFYQSKSFWLHGCGAAVAVNVIVGANNLLFVSIGEFLNSMVVYYVDRFTIVITVITIVTAFIYAFQFHKQDSVLQTLLGVSFITIAATILFGAAGWWALAIAGSFLGGLTIHSNMSNTKTESDTVVSPFPQQSNG